VVHLERAYRKYKGRATFAFIAVAEAGHRLPGYEYLLADPGVPRTPRGAAARRRRVARAARQAGLSVPGFLDGPDRPAARAYSAFPERLVVVDARGGVAHDFGYNPRRPWDWERVGRLLERLGAGGAAAPHRAAAPTH
jgi:hypothetical protein